jgi:hypothetical protein
MRILKALGIGILACIGFCTCAVATMDTPEERRANQQQRQEQRQAEAASRAREVQSIADATGVSIEHIECKTVPNICWFDVDGVLKTKHRRAAHLIRAYVETLPPNRSVTLTWRVVENVKGLQGQEMIRTYSSAQYSTYFGKIEEK